MKNFVFLLIIALGAFHNTGFAQNVKPKEMMTNATKPPLSTFNSPSEVIEELVMQDGKLYMKQSDESFLLSKTENNEKVKRRKISTAEYEFAKKIFVNEFPSRDEITITNLISPTADGIAYYVRPSIGNNYIYVNMGASYDNPVGKKPGTFAHELAHVWQIRHYGVLKYFEEFVRNQVFCKDAYAYVCNANKTLQDYNFEQQGELVRGYYNKIICDTKLCKLAFELETHLGTEVDRCSETLYVKDKNNTWKKIPANATTVVDVKVDTDGYWYWRCGTSGEKSRGGSDFRKKVDRLRVTHNPGSRKITWECYDVK